MSRNSPMCEECQAAPWKPLTRSAAGSPANLFRMRENGKRKAMIGGCGRNSPVWWARWDPDSSSWRMCQGFGQPRMQVPRLSLTLPRSAMTSDGIVYLLPPLGPHTSGSESSLWPTPTSRDWKGQNQRNVESCLPGAVSARQWPTPTVNDGLGGPGRHGREGGANLRTAVSESSGGETQPKSLNPAWVEWLMGFPEGWTDLGD